MKTTKNASPTLKGLIDKDAINRRNFIGASSAAMLGLLLAQARGADMESTIKADKDNSASDPGPENTELRDVQPDDFTPPPTDNGEPANFWSSFDLANRRVQEGGWSRQITVQDFPISKDIAGVNMRLIAGGIRELHWHNAGEWAIMLNGKARITCLDDGGKMFINDVNQGDLWFFPTGLPHSIQGLAPDGCEFVLVFDDGNFSEDNTTLLSDWLKHTPPEVVAKNFGVSEKDIVLPVYRDTPSAGRYIFQAPVPGDLESDKQSIGGAESLSPTNFSFMLSKLQPRFKTQYGEVRIVDSRNFPPSSTIAAAHVIVRPGGVRELHWHQNADEWQYYIQGKGRMTVFFNGAHAHTRDFDAGDIGYVPKTFGHYIENTGDTDLVFLEMFKSNAYADLALNQWVSHLPPELLKAHIGISKDDLLAKIPMPETAIVPA